MSSFEDDARQIRSTSYNDGDYQPLVPADEDVNGAAKSWGADPQPRGSAGDGGLPCIQVAGVTVWLYRQDGVMRVSLDTDDADETTPMVNRGAWNERIPVQFDVNGHTVWEG